mmetsp:Transcript_23634/g.51642  ORF Transcript_23634/g.51642 Transcript_23634/m.51642 type:complete len:235 (+) Transcript_23634:1070-1774(+)
MADPQPIDGRRLARRSGDTGRAKAHGLVGAQGCGGGSHGGAEQRAARLRSARPRGHGAARRELPAADSSDAECAVASGGRGAGAPGALAAARADRRHLSPRPLPASWTHCRRTGDDGGPPSRGRAAGRGCGRAEEADAVGAGHHRGARLGRLADGASVAAERLMRDGKGGGGRGFSGRSAHVLRAVGYVLERCTGDLGQRARVARGGIKLLVNRKPGRLSRVVGIAKHVSSSDR